MKALPREFYLQDVQKIAKELLGKLLIHNTPKGTAAIEITETEAYLGVEDPASHCFGNRYTARTKIIYGLGGHAYIYIIYGMYYLFNAVTGDEGNPCAVLVRAGKPLKNHELLSQNRYNKPYKDLSKAQLRAFCDGPGKLTKALGLTLAQNGLDLCDSTLFISDNEHLKDDFKISAGPRIGVDYAGEAAKWPLNFRII